MTRVIVIGGGVIGVSTAIALARRGCEVVVLERSDALATGASGRNGGQLSFSYVDALASPAVVRALPCLLMGRDPAFQVRLQLTGAFIEWAVRFLANCRTSRFVSNTRAVLRLALLSRSALERLQGEYSEIEFCHRVPGKLVIYERESEFRSARMGIAIKREFGVEQRVLGREELLDLEPALLSSGRDVCGAVYSPLDGVGDPQAFTNALAAIATSRYGAIVNRGVDVESLVVKRGRVCAVMTRQGAIEADRVVLAAGVNSSVLGRTGGLSLPILPMKGYSVTLPAKEAAPRVSITDRSAKIVFCRLGDNLRVAGMAELGKCDSAIDARQVRVLLNSAKDCLPEAADWCADPNPWSGLRPMSPDCRPIIGATQINGLFLNCGHGMLGWTLACGSAELVAAAVMGIELETGDRGISDEFCLSRF